MEQLDCNQLTSYLLSLPLFLLYQQKKKAQLNRVSPVFFSLQTTFHNSGHYVLHYQGSTNILNPSQESSQSSTSTQSPPLDVLPKGLGSTSSATTDAVCQGLGGTATSSHSSCCRVQPNPWSPHSSQHHSYLHLDPRDECQEGAQSSLLPQRPPPQDPLLQGERCSLLPSVYSQNSSKDRTVKETVV